MGIWPLPHVLAYTRWIQFGFTMHMYTSSQATGLATTQWTPGLVWHKMVYDTLQKFGGICYPEGLFMTQQNYEGKI
jgi:hypothetical protein